MATPKICSLSINLALCAVFAMHLFEFHQVAAEKRSVLDLPDLNILTTTDQSLTKYKFSGCEIGVSKDGCNVSFAPDSGSCKSGISLNQIIKRFFPSLDLKKVSDGMVLPSIFEIEKFVLNKCQGDIEFTATAKEPFDVIANKLKISQGKITLAFNFKASDFDIKSFGIKINGVLTVGAQTLKIEADKKKNSDEFSFSAKGDKISLDSFSKLFTKKDIAEDASKKVKSLTSASIDKPKITGLKTSDGYFEFVIWGNVRDLSIMDKAEVFLIVQKPPDEKVAVALVCQFKGVSPTEIISMALDKDLSKLPLIKDVTMNFLLEIASGTMETVRDKEVNKAMLKYISGGKTICKGAKLRVELPIHEIMRTVNKKMVGKVPEILYVNIFISSSGIEFVFTENFQTDLINILIALTPAIPKLLPKSVFKNGPPRVDIKRFVVDVKTGEVDVSVVAPDPIVIGNDLVNITDAAFDLKHDKKPDSPWEFKISAEQKIGDAVMKISVEKKGKNNFIFSAAVKSMTTKALMSKFGTKLFPTKSLEDMKFFNFGIKDLNVKGTIGDKLSLRVTGDPVLFDWEGAKLEGFIFGDETKSMALGVSLAKIRLDEIVMKLFKKKLKSSWLSELDVFFTISNVDAGKDKEIAFTRPELKNTKIKKGVVFSSTFTLPSDCKGDALCKEAKSILDKDTKLFLEGEVLPKGMELKAGYKGNMKIQGSLELTNVQFVVSVGTETSVYFEVVLKMTEPKITFKGKLAVSATGKLELKLTMDNLWKKPFGLQYLAFGNLILSVGIQPGVPVPILEIGGEMHFGKIDSGKEIKAKTYLGISPNNPVKNYFYTNINKLSIGTVAQAFDYDITLPKVLTESGFPEGLIASFTMNPAGKSIDHLGIKIDPGFSLKGLVNILGFKLKCKIVLNFKKEIEMEVSFSPIKLANGLIALQRSKKDEENGPKLYAKLTTKSVAVNIDGYASLLGISAGVSIAINDDSMKFHMYGNLFDIFAANLTVQAGYKKIEEADFLVSSCLSTPIGNIQNEVGSSLEKSADEANKAVSTAEKKVEKSTNLFDKANEKFVEWEEKVKKHEDRIKETCDKVQEIKEDLGDSCLDKCGEVCAGGAYWKKKCTKVLGQWLGCSKWNKCKHKVPDAICLAKCKGGKVVSKVKGVAKQAGIEVLLGMLKGLKKALNVARSFVDKARSLVAIAEKGLNAVKKVVSVGIEIGKAIANYTVNGLVNIHHLCFNTSLEKASSACFGVNINATLFGKKRVEFVADTCLDVSFISSIAKVVKTKLFPGVKLVKEGLQKAKALFFDMDAKKEELESDIKKEEEMEKSPELADEDKRSEITFNEEEKYFKKIAYSDLPRITLRDDMTMKAFEEDSPWSLIARDEMFEEDSSDDDLDNAESGSGEEKHFALEARDFSSALKEPNGCRAVRSALSDLRPIVTALHSFHENLHLQRKSYIEEKKSKLNELKSVQEELESECDDEGLNEEDKKDAMFYMDMARNGTLNWLDMLKLRIKEQEKRGLIIWKHGIESIMKHKRGTSVGAFLKEINQKQSTVSKKEKIGSALKEKLKLISKMTEKLLFDTHLSFEKDKNPLMHRLQKEFDSAEHLLKSCGPFTAHQGQHQ